LGDFVKSNPEGSSLAHVSCEEIAHAWRDDRPCLAADLPGIEREAKALAALWYGAFLDRTSFEALRGHPTG
jgi:hypothetical protein